MVLRRGLGTQKEIGLCDREDDAMAQASASVALDLINARNITSFDTQEVEGK